MKPSEFKISFSVESYVEKTPESCRNFYDDEESIVSELSKISVPNIVSVILRLDSKLSSILPEQ